MQVILNSTEIQQQFFNIKMNANIRARKEQNYQKITPWETQNDTTDFDSYLNLKVSDKRAIQSRQQQPNRFPQLLIKRPFSNCRISNKQNNSNKFATLKSIHDKLSDSSKIGYPSLIGNKLEKSKAEKQSILQEISVKNFIIQGGSWQNYKFEHPSKKKQSSYILKQKFAQIRRSMNLMVNKEMTSLKVHRYQI